MTMNEKIQEIQLILEDYSEVLWEDPKIKEHVLNLIGRFYQTGQDVNETELDALAVMLKNKVNEFVKDKGN